MTDLKLPGFEVIEKLGQGGMATVWKARQISLDRTVAIKILLSRMSRDPSDVERFLAEARSAAKLKHPGIVQVYDANVMDNLYYFVMEFIGGYTVSDWIKRKGHLSENDALLVAQSVADALGYAWDSQKLIHCDIKPDNVMVDADGTLKVTDLGLARTIRAAYDKEFEDEVLGTPAYMSPEQVMGKADLDFKSDIYSLGAMLFHMATGRLMFADQTEDAVMELHVNGADDDPHDVNPKLSMPICWLIEKMLIKDRENRYGSWAEVQNDILRVKKGIAPAGVKPKEGMSSVHRSKLRNHPDSFRNNVPRKQESPSMALPVLAGFMLLFGAVGAGIWYYQGQQEKIRELEKQRIVVQRNERATAEQEAELKLKDNNAREMLDFAEKWASQNPEKHDEIVSRFKAVSTQTRGTKYALMADSKISEYTSAKNQAVEREYAQLVLNAGKLESAGDLLGAAKLFDEYAGRFASETAPRRKEAASKLRAKQLKIETQMQSAKETADKKFEELLEQVAGVILKEGTGKVPAMLDANETKPEFANHLGAISEIKQIISGALNIDSEILKSFAAQAGTEVTISTTTGPRKYTIKEIRGGKIIAEQKKTVGSAQYAGSYTIALSDLSLKERLSRMKDDAGPGVALCKGLLMFGAKQKDDALKYFAATGPHLSKPLTLAAGNMLNAAGVSSANGASEKDDVPSNNGKLDKRPPVVLEKQAHVIPEKYQGMVNDREAVRDALRDLNSDFEEWQIQFEPNWGKEAPMSVTFSGNGRAALRDISPLAALPSLKKVRYSRPPEAKCRLEDISCLKGLDLKELELTGCRITDISALKGMELEELDLSGTDISNLTPLKSMKVSKLVLDDIKASDFSAIQEIEGLQELSIANNNIKDLRFLKGLKIESLDVSGLRMMDLSQLSSLSLRTLKLSGATVKSLDFLRNMQLERLDLSGTAIASIAMLKGLPIKHLDISNTAVRDFSVLRELPLESINLSGTAFALLDMLKGKRLESLDLSKTKIIDLNAVADMPLEFLNIENTYVSNLKALKNSSVKTLMCRDAKISDYSPLSGSGIERLWINDPLKNREVIREMDRLKLLNGRKPSDLFRDLMREMERNRDDRRNRHAPR